MTERFAMVPGWVVNAGLSKPLMGAYVALAYQCDYSAREIRFDYMEDLAKLWGVQRWAASKTLRALESAGVIAVLPSRGVRISLPADRDGAQTTRECVKNHTPPCEESHADGAQTTRECVKNHIHTLSTEGSDLFQSVQKQPESGSELLREIETLVPPRSPERKTTKGSSSKQKRYSSLDELLGDLHKPSGKTYLEYWQQQFPAYDGLHQCRPSVAEEVADAWDYYRGKTKYRDITRCITKWLRRDYDRVEKHLKANGGQAARGRTDKHGNPIPATIEWTPQQQAAFDAGYHFYDGKWHSKPRRLRSGGQTELNLGGG